ncbi:SDR family oxidoreductase [Duganella aceris]|uniref:SDR family NAD(P)-dependent oxidoreductase n=1 Tax=Duganella aceris TaxID=2703883 RepID=A0ABX0FNV8_9BURK|nr:SDR family NAD(P)-dependent oxidoreductase [Duganella aceris]NGZ86162.1 SDR family NAD(P)-dependent oxidoreductase [Duganella aceris]
MKLSGNTILITGGTSGIGRALAEALHKLDNQVIISGRRKALLDEVTAANPGMKSIEFDVGSAAAIKVAGARLIADFPKLNVLINNAGIMHIDNAAAEVDEEMMQNTITTNLMGPIRMTGALIEHLKAQPSATVINVSSVLAFVPMAMTAVYSSTKAALHSYTMSLRWNLKDTPVKVLELSPPWVQTDLLNSKEEPRAMPLQQFIDETIAVLGTDVTEVLVEGAKQMRANPGPNEYEWVNQFNDILSQPA